MKTKININDDPEAFQAILDDLAKCKITESTSHTIWKDVFSYNQGGYNAADVTSITYEGNTVYGEEVWHLEYGEISKQQGGPHILTLHILHPKVTAFTILDK